MLLTPFVSPVSRGTETFVGWLCLLPLNDKASESNAMTVSHVDSLWSDRLHIMAAEHLASVLNVTFHRPLSRPTV